MAAGFKDFQELTHLPESNAFGDTAVVFRIGSLLLRFTKERGEEFLDLAASVEPAVFHQFDDVDIAMGWKSINDVLAKREPEDIDILLARIKSNLDILSESFSGNHERLTRARVQRAARERGQAFAARLRGSH